MIDRSNHLEAWDRDQGEALAIIRSSATCAAKGSWPLSSHAATPRA
jgi:hypothetical protein